MSKYLTTLFVLFHIFLIFIYSPIGAAYSDSKQLTYTKATIQTNLKSVAGQETLWIALNLDLEPGWHVYWKNPGDSGLPPKLLIESNQDIEVGDILYAPPHRIPVQHLINYGYDQNASYFLPITFKSSLKNKQVNLKIKASWLVCKVDCIPEEASFNFSLPISNTVEYSDNYQIMTSDIQAIQNIKQLSPKVTEEAKQVALEFTRPEWKKQSIQDAYFFAEKEGVISLSQFQAYQQDGIHLTLRLSKESQSLPKKLRGFLEVIDEKAVQHYQVNVDHSSDNDTQTNKTEKQLTLGLAFLFAFLGGILLNFMPCVFPILSLKILGLCQQQSARYLQKCFHAFSYTFGILLCFLVIAIIMIALQSAGLAVGWGFQMQSGIFLLVMIYLLVLVSCFLFGFINFWLPLPRFSNGHQSHPYMESFSTGLLITLISTPCTAPLMAPALGFAFTQSSENMIAIILLLGLGLALPFILFAVIPGCNRLLPKSGPWLSTFKEFMAFPMLFTGLWLCWLLLNHINTVQFIIVLASVLCLWMLLWVGKLKFKYRLIKIILQIILLAPIGFTFYQIGLESPSQVTDSKLNIFSMDKVEELRQKNQPILVNVTADWCITCKANESLVLSQKTVKDFISKNNIVYLKADWTHRSQAITEYLKSFDRYGVPLYVYYPSKGDPIVLPQILTPDIIFDKLSED